MNSQDAKRVLETALICASQPLQLRDMRVLFAGEVGREPLRSLLDDLPAEWAASGLQINGIAPGYIHTELTQNLVDDEKFNSWILGRTPANRWGTVEDLVGPAVWLASDASNFVNGQTIFIDGGMTVVV